MALEQQEVLEPHMIKERWVQLEVPVILNFLTLQFNFLVLNFNSAQIVKSVKSLFFESRTLARVIKTFFNSSFEFFKNNFHNNNKKYTLGSQ